MLVVRGVLSTVWCIQQCFSVYNGVLVAQTSRPVLSQVSFQQLLMDLPRVDDARAHRRVRRQVPDTWSASPVEAIDPRVERMPKPRNPQARRR